MITAAMVSGWPVCETRSTSLRSERILMCAPEHFGIRYEINPWMHSSDQPNSSLATKQWNELYRILSREIGCEVDLVRQSPDCPDMVFTANAGLVLDRLVLLSRFRHAQRRTEEPGFERWFLNAGFRVLRAPDDLRFEGEGDALLAGEFVLAGYMNRSDIGSHAWISESLHKPVLSLGLVDSRWYHLDTCLFVLRSDLVALYPGAFDEYALKVLRSAFETIDISTEEALKFACNSVVLGSHVIMPSGCPGLTRCLEQRGYSVHGVEMTEFIKAGGATKCLTLFLDRAGS